MVIDLRIHPHVSMIHFVGIANLAILHFAAWVPKISVSNVVLKLRLEWSVKFKYCCLLLYLFIF